VLLIDYAILFVFIVLAEASSYCGSWGGGLGGFSRMQI